MNLGDIDLTDLAQYADGAPHDKLQFLRNHAPVCWFTPKVGPGFWAITRYNDVATLYRDTRRLSSEGGNLLVTRGSRDIASGKMLVVTDPPRHTEMRLMLNAALTPAQVHKLRSEIRALIRAVLMRFVNLGEGDFVTEVASKIPTAVTCRLMGIPLEDQAEMNLLTNRSQGAYDDEHAGYGPARAAAADAHTRLLAYFDRLVANRRSLPGDDLISMLLVNDSHGRRLSHDEILLNCLNLLIGGNETTRHAISGSVVALAECKKEWILLKSGIDTSIAVEEVLRWTSPGMSVMRLVTEEFALRSHTLKRDDIVTLWIASANRDEDVFGAPNEFDLQRWPNRHLSFGIGPHYCIGAAIAKLELAEFLSEMRAQIANVELTAAPIALRSVSVSGLKQLNLRVRPL